MDGVMRALAKKKTEWKEDLFFAVKSAQQTMSKYYADMAPSTRMVIIPTHILNPLQKLRLLRKWDMGIDINPEDATSYTTQYQKAFLKYVENEYCAKHQHVPVNKPESILSSNLVPSATASGSGKSSFDPYFVSSNDEEYLSAETTPRRSDRAECILTDARLHLNPPPEAPKNWGQINPNLDDYHSNPVKIGSTLWLPDIAEWLHQQEETHFKYADLSNVLRKLFSIMPHAVGVYASFSVGQDIIGWRKSRTTGTTFRDELIVRQLARANNGILEGADPVLDTMNTKPKLEMKKQAEDRKLHRMANVHDFWEMWQGSQNLGATQEESHAQNKQMTAVGYISDTEEIVKASRSLFHNDGAAAFQLSEWSPLPPAVTPKNLPGGRTQILNVHWIRRISCHPVKSDKDSAYESISDTEYWLNWDGDLDNPNDCKDDCAADVETDIELDNAIDFPECPEQQGVSPTSNVPWLILPTRKSMRQAETVLVTVNAIETRRNQGVQKK